MYGIKYRYEFDGLRGQPYQLDILQDGYTGDIIPVIGTGEPVLHKWQEDRPKAPIKGSVLEVDLINENDDLPLSSFASAKDLEFKAMFYHGTDLKFTGFMVQDDSSEILFDPAHPIRLSFTDGLGLLKDVHLNESPKAFYLFKTLTGVNDIFTTPIHQISSIILSQDVQAGDRIVITGTTFPGVYNIVSNFISTSGGYMVSHIEVKETLINTTTQTATSIQIYRKIIDGRKSLAEIIKIALAPAYLDLSLNAYSGLKPVGGSTGRWLDDTYIDTYTFLNGQDSWQDCYQVLESVLKTFKATLFQAHGFWNIVRWDELRQYGGAIPGNSYDADMTYTGTVTLSSFFTAGIGETTFAEYELSETINRPLKTVFEQFDYKQPAEVLRNANFARVGKIVNVYPGTGTDVITDYEMAEWDAGYEWTSGGGGYIASTATRLIRVIRNAAGGELERYGVIKGNSGLSNYHCAESFPIDITIGDRIKYSFEVRTNVSQPGNVNLYYSLCIITTAAFTPRSPNNKYLNQFGAWQSFGSANLLLYAPVPSGSNTNQWATVSVESKESPVNGQLFISLSQNVNGTSPTRETHYRNLRFEIIRSIANTTTITGHTHTDTQTAEIRNRQDETVEIDDSPSNALSGTLFLSSFTERLQNRTTLWNRGTAPGSFSLGNITTYDELFWRRIQRRQLEGTYHTLMQDDLLSLLTQINYTLYPGATFIWGSMEIDYAKDKAKGNLYEMYQDTETDASLQENYEFNYLYDNK